MKHDIVTLFDLLFILLFLITVLSVLTAALLALLHQYGRAGKILTRILIGAAIYFAIVIAVSLIPSHRIMKIGERQCFDDMCVSVIGYQSAQETAGRQYRVEVGLFNRGRGVSQRENNLVLYLVDDQGHRYDLVADSSGGPLNVRLRPQESAVLRRSFLVPQNANGIAAVITHEGGFPIRWFIIDYDTWFRKPPLVPLS